LCQITPEGVIDVIAPINNDYEDEEKLLCMIKALDEDSKKNDLKKIEDYPQSNIFIMKFS